MMKKINQQVLLETLCFLLFAFVMLYFLITKKYLSYVTPRMVPYLCFASAVMMIWAVCRIRDLFHVQYKTKAFHCLILIVPILFLLLPHNFLYASANSSGYLGSAGLAIASGKNLQSAAQIRVTQTGVNQAGVNQSGVNQTGTAQVSGNLPDQTDNGPRVADENDGEEATAIGETDSKYRDSIIKTESKTASEQVSAGTVSAGTVSTETQNGETQNGETQNGEESTKQGNYDNAIRQQYGLNQAADGSIMVTDGQFYGWSSEIFTNMKRYDGVKITIRGFVYKDPQTMSGSQFVPARMLMYCCSADVCPCGLICSYDKTDTLQENSWVTVTGMIHLGQYQGKTSPIINVTSVSQAQAPQDEYVYP